MCKRWLVAKCAFPCPPYWVVILMTGRMNVNQERTNYKNVYDSSPIEIFRIKIFCLEQKISCSVSDLRSADKTLAAWSKAAAECIKCGFQVHFEDGFSIEGTLSILPTDKNFLSYSLKKGVDEILSSGRTAEVSPKTGQINYHNGISRNRLMRYRLDDSSAI